MLTAQCLMLTAKKKIMKKTLLLTLALMLTAMTFAQGHAFLNESFDSAEWPEGWTISEIGKDNWSISESNKAGGEANELKFYFLPPVVFETTRVITPALNLNGTNEVVVSFRHTLENQIDPFAPYKIGIATSLDTINWNVGWEGEYLNNGHYEVYELISTPDLGNERVYFSLYFTGYSGAMNDWSFDDIVISSRGQLDLSISSIDIPDMSRYGNKEVSFTVQNTGSSDITSFEAKYEIDDKVITETFNTNIESLNFQQFTFSQAAYLATGTHNISVEIVSVNGESDSDESNNILEKEFELTLGDVNKITMIEHFSSSTCYPYCVEANNHMLQVEQESAGKYTYVKYPFYGPGLGDPYFINEVGYKKNYYDVKSVPTLYFDGKETFHSSVTAETINDIYNTKTFSDIRGSFKVEGNTINITADFMSYIKLDNVRAYVAINEKTTTGNTGTNGETEFHHILMRMLKDHDGTVMNINAGEYQRLEFSLDMSTTFMEDINDLEVALWLQNYETKEVYNSRFAYEYTEHCYPVQNLNAVEILDCTGAVEISWEAPEKGNPIGYNIYINGKLIAENNANELSYHSEDPQLIEEVRLGESTAEVVAVYEDGKTSVSVIKVLDGIWENVEENLAADNIKVYPNPVNDRLYIEVETEVEEVVVYDVYGRVQNLRNSETQKLRNSIDLSDLKAGIYFVKINTEGGNIVKRIIKN